MSGIKIEFIQAGEDQLAIAFAKKVEGYVYVYGADTPIYGGSAVNTVKINTEATEGDVRKAAEASGCYVKQTGDASFEITNSYSVARKGGYLPHDEPTERDELRSLRLFVLDHLAPPMDARDEYLRLTHDPERIKSELRSLWADTLQEVLRGFPGYRGESARLDLDKIAPHGKSPRLGLDKTAPVKTGIDIPITHYAPERSGVSLPAPKASKPPEAQ